MSILQIPHRLQHIKPSATLEISEKAHRLIAAGEDIINLSAGEPAIDTPLNIKAAAIQAINEGITKYTPVSGISKLKKTICQYYLRTHNLSYQPEEVIISSGAKHAIMNTLLAYINPGDEVLIPTPYWTSYPEMVKLAGGTPKFIPCDQSTRFLLTPQELEKYITPKTRMLIINSPSNPSGMCYNAAELSGLSEILAHYKNILILSDDIYETIQWQGDFQNLVMVNKDMKNRCIIINGVSKAYAMTGWRIGYALGPAPIISSMSILQSQMTSCPCSISQMAAIEALESPGMPKEQLKQYQQRHQLIYDALTHIPGVEVTPSDGTFYILPNVHKLMQKMKIKNDVAFAAYLLDHLKLATVPGSAFGAENHIRISFALSKEKLKEAIKRLNTLAK